MLQYLHQELATITILFQFLVTQLKDVPVPQNGSVYSGFKELRYNRSEEVLSISTRYIYSLT